MALNHQGTILTPNNAIFDFHSPLGFYKFKACDLGGKLATKEKTGIVLYLGAENREQRPRTRGEGAGFERRKPRKPRAGAERESNPRGETLSRPTPQPPAPTPTPKTKKTESGVAAGIGPTRGDTIGLARRRLNRPPPPPPRKPRKPRAGAKGGIEPTRGDPIGLAGRRLKRPPPLPPRKLRKP